MTHSANVRVLPKPRPASSNQTVQSPSGGSWFARATVCQPPSSSAARRSANQFAFMALLSVARRSELARRRHETTATLQAPLDALQGRAAMPYSTQQSPARIRGARISMKLLVMLTTLGWGTSSRVSCTSNSRFLRICAVKLMNVSSAPASNADNSAMNAN